MVPSHVTDTYRSTMWCPYRISEINAEVSYVRSYLGMFKIRFTMAERKKNENPAKGPTISRILKAAPHPSTARLTGESLQ